MKAREPRPSLQGAMTVAAFYQVFCITPELYAALKRTGLGPRDVRIGDVRFGSHSGLKSDIAACPKSATSGLLHRSISRDAASGTHSGKPRRAKAFSNSARRFGFLILAKFNSCLKLGLRRCGYRARM
jgi:hypothetical protein